MEITKISLENPLARGRTADVYEWDDGHILKLFHGWFSLEDIKYELKIARAVHASGVKCPAVKELVQFQGRNGLIYQRMDGISMLDVFQRQPWKVFQFAKVLANLHAQMHERAFNTDVPDQRRKLEYKIQNANPLPTPLKTALLNSLHSLPESDRVCHGDFHPANVLIHDDEATVIDWIDASRGNPLADVARTSIIILGAIAASHIFNPLQKMFVSMFHATYLREYFRIRPHGMNEYQQWLPIVAGARLSENIPELETWLIKQAG